MEENERAEKQVVNTLQHQLVKKVKIETIQIKASRLVR